MEAQPCCGLVLNVPEFFADADFLRWLETDLPKFTWHRNGQVSEWSDVVVLVDPGLSGEGSDADMPPAIWDQIVDMCRMHLGCGGMQSHFMVRLTNLPV